MGFLELGCLQNIFGCFVQNLSHKGQFFTAFLPIVNCINQEKKVFFKSGS